MIKQTTLGIFGILILASTLGMNFARVIPGYYRLILTIPCNAILGYISGVLIAEGFKGDKNELEELMDKESKEIRHILTEGCENE